MKQLKKSLTVSTIAVCGIGWFAFTNKAIDELKNTPSHELHKLEDLSMANKIKDGNSNIHKEYERLVEEERLRLEELERQRLERLEKIRLAKIEEAKKLERQRKLEEERKKKEQHQTQVSRGESKPTKDGQYFEVTFYTAGVESTGKSKGDKWYGITASGTTVKEGRTVACPKSINFGTKIYIEGFGYRICEDRGSAIVDGRLDIYVESLTKAKQLGRKKLKVTIIK